MAWRTPTVQDLAAKLSNAEIEQFKRLPDFASAADPVEDILKLTASMVRGYIRRNKQVKMSEGNYDIPESLMSAAMDCAAFDLLKLMPGVPVSHTEWRSKAYEVAKQTLEMVARNDITPESFNEGDDESNMATPFVRVSGCDPKARAERMADETQADEVLSELTPRPSAASSREIGSEWSDEMKRQALFSARTTSRAYLEDVKRRLAEVAAGTVTPQVAVSRLRESLGNLGYTPAKGFPGEKKVPAAVPKSMEDLSLDSRIELVLDMNVRRARSLGQIATNQNPHAILSTPAWKLTRTGWRKKPRGDWKARWQAAGDACAWNGALRTRFVALKHSPIWEKLGEGAGGFADALGSPYPPFAFGSGMTWIGVDRKDWVKLCERDGVPDGMDGVWEIARKLKREQDGQNRAPASFETSAGISTPESGATAQTPFLGRFGEVPAMPVNENGRKTKAQERAKRDLEETIGNVEKCSKEIAAKYLPALDEMKTDANAIEVMRFENEMMEAHDKMEKWWNAACACLVKVDDAKPPTTAEEEAAHEQRMGRFSAASGRYEAMALELAARCKARFNEAEGRFGGE